MISDFRSRVAEGDLTCDLLIIGGGAAGITLAREFIASGVRVCLVESGGLEFDGATQALYEGAIVGRDYGTLDSTRLRFYGGTTNHWGGSCIALSPIDFTRRDHVPHSGWPFDREHLEPFYRRARKVLKVGDYTDFHLDRPGAEVVPFFDGSGPFEPEVWHHNRDHQDFANWYRAELERAADLDVLLNANVTRLIARPDGAALTGAEIATLDGRRATIRAKVVVLACGGIENPRLLLVSDDVVAAGIGNSHDLVGRFFMEHPILREPAVGSVFGDLTWGYPFKHVKDRTGNYLPGLRLTAASQREHRLANGSCSIDLQLEVDDTAGYANLATIRRALSGEEQARDLGGALWNVVTDLDDVARGMWAKLTDTWYEPPLSASPQFVVISRTEQSPNPASRVTLTGDRDALGLRRVALDWRLTELDKRTVRVMIELLAKEVGRHGLGRLKLAETFAKGDDQWPDDLDWGNHHMGTTRMHDQPRHGVVDPDCRVHGLANLFVAGSSVFPTGGHANPTFTIVALTLRLADHLKRRGFAS